MVHECRMQGAGSPSYYDRVPKLKQSMCGGIGHMSGANPDHMHHIAQNKLKDKLPCICFKRHCQLLCLAYILKTIKDKL